MYKNLFLIIKMKVLIFICLITQLFGAIHYMDKYGVSSSIESGSGIVALDISGFNEGSSI